MGIAQKMNPKMITGIKKILNILGERVFTNIKTQILTHIKITIINNIREGKKYNKLVPFENHVNMSITVPRSFINGKFKNPQYKNWGDGLSGLIKYYFSG